MKFIRSIILVSVVFYGNLLHAAEFFVIPGTTTLLLLGETSANDVGALRDAVEKQQVDTIVLKGPGGDLEAAFVMADFIIENQLSTVVPAGTDCASACSLIFLAGANRTLEEGARLGFHLPFMSTSASEEEFLHFCRVLVGERPRGEMVGTLFEYRRSETLALSTRCAVSIYQLGLRDIRRLNALVVRDSISEELMDIIIDTMPENMTWVDASRAVELGIIKRPHSN